MKPEQEFFPWGEATGCPSTGSIRWAQSVSTCPFCAELPHLLSSCNPWVVSEDPD
jgi:hypothetical protein